MANISNKRTIRIVVEDVEFSITAPAVKAQQIADLVLELGGSAICAWNFTLSSQQYAKFASKSTFIVPS